MLVAKAVDWQRFFAYQMVRRGEKDAGVMLNF